MILRFSRIVVCGSLVAAMGCQNTFDRSAKFGDRDSFETRLSVASDDVSELEVGRGHEPSLASEIADRRQDAEDAQAARPSTDSRLTVQRLLERGHEAAAHDQPQEAKRYYEKALVEEPENAVAHHRLAILADRAGDFATAEAHYQKALKTKPGNADVLNDLGYSCFLQGRAADSERYLNQALKINPRHPHVEENLSLLYDEEKAERVLSTVMGPRQTQATLAQLFQGTSGTEPQRPLAQMPGDRAATPRSLPANSLPETPADLEALERKMAEARMRSIAERQQRNAQSPTAGDSHRLASLPQLPEIYPSGVSPQVPPQNGQASLESPEERIPDAFRSLDGGHSASDFAHQGLMADPSTDRPAQQEMTRTASIHAMDAPDQRASAPQWNTPPEPWPGTVPESRPAQAIELASYNEPAAHPPASSSQQSLTAAAQRAAEIGMATGPGTIFPAIGDSADSGTHAQAPATRFYPGAHSPTMHSQPAGHEVPSHRDSAPQQQPSSNPGPWGQPSAGWDNQAHPPEAFAAQFGSAPPTPPAAHAPANGWTQDQYDQMRAVHNAPVPQALATDPGTMTTHPPREVLPATRDIGTQSWPAQGRESYNARPQDLPTITPQPSATGQSNLGGQSVPPYNAPTPQAPQNSGSSW